MKRLSLAMAFAISAAGAGCGYADQFGSGENSFEIDFVTIGDPGNPADTSEDPRPVGSVPYEYRISKFEVSEDMVQKANLLGGLDITTSDRGEDKPATEIDWFEAAQFVNWLNTASGHSPAYKFGEVAAPDPSSPPTSEFALWEAGDAGFDPNNLFRNRLAKYVLPSLDEWYKAAFYEPSSGLWLDYPTPDGLPPIPVASGTLSGTAVFSQGNAGPADIFLAGGESNYGTVGQSGNAYEWLETETDMLNDEILGLRGQFGGNWSSSLASIAASDFSGGFPDINMGATGFRIASVPEPGSAVIVVVALCISSCREPRMELGRNAASGNRRR